MFIVLSFVLSTLHNHFTCGKVRGIIQIGKELEKGCWTDFNFPGDYSGRTLNFIARLCLDRMEKVIVKNAF